MSGRLIVLEGLDGSGKSTQLRLVHNELLSQGINIKTISFPDYNDPSSTLVKMYLGGEFGSSAGDVNAYAASIFYAADRYASFVRYWRDYYEEGGVVLCGRYVSSNAIHQASKLPREEWGGYMDWLYELEFERIRIPKPDLTFFLDMPRDVADRLIISRYSGDENKKDVHERDMQYMRRCSEAADFACERLGWVKIPCSDGVDPLPTDLICQSICDKIMQVIG